MRVSLQTTSEKKGCGQEHLERTPSGELIGGEVSVPFDILKRSKRLVEMRLESYKFFTS